MTHPDDTSFDNLLLLERIAPAQFDNVLDAMEAAESTDMIRQLGDRILYMMRRGEIAPGRGQALLNDLLAAARSPLDAGVRVAEIRGELKERKI